MTSLTQAAQQMVATNTSLASQQNLTLELQLYDEMIAKGCMANCSEVKTNSSGFWRFSDQYDSQGKTSGWCLPIYTEENMLVKAVFGTHRDSDETHHWESSGFSAISQEERDGIDHQIEQHRQVLLTERAAMMEKNRQGLSRALKGLVSSVTHPYLQAKGIEGHGALQGANDELYIPLSDVNNHLITAQRIKPDGSKFLWSGCGKTGGMFKIAGDSRVILISEGFATASSLFEATGYTSVMAIDAGNLIHVTRAIQEKYPNSVIVLCGDNDQFGAKNTGLEKCQKIQAELGVPFILPQFEDLATKPTDFNDLSQLLGTGAVKTQLEPVIEQARLRLPRGFVHKNDGVYYEQTDKNGNTQYNWICSPLKITALTRDSSSESWGKLIELTNSDGINHSFAMPNVMLTAQAAEYLKPLVDKGLTYDHKFRDQLHQYLSHSAPVNRALCIDKTGWFNGCFVLPQDVIGESSETIVFQSNAHIPKGFEQQGTLEEWKENVSALCVDNSRLTFGVSTAFATALLPMVDGESGGFHFRCGSSRGKTTILMVAKSVWGSPESLPRWRATSNGLEGLAIQHNHSLLCLDEFSQLAEVNPKVAGETIYMLGNGEGKQRMQKDATLANRCTWQLLYLSAGEVSLRATLEQAGIPVRAGQEVRFIDLPADAGCNLGVFNSIHNYEDGNRFAMAIKENSCKYYGVAARAFLCEIAGDYQAYQEWLFNKVSEFTNSLQLCGADPQVLRVAQRFAIVAAAGELATKLNITAWPEGMATNSAIVCFKEWLNQRGGMESHEETQAIDAVRSRLLENSNTRFMVDTLAPRGSSCWGLKDTNGYYVYPSAFNNELCAGLDPKFVANLLAQKDFLTSRSGRNTITKRIDGNTIRCYHIKPSLLEDESGSATEAIEELQQLEYDSPINYDMGDYQGYTV